MRRTVEDLRGRYPKLVDLLDPTLVVPGRAQGNTTRQVDKAIQLLFKGHPILVLDNYLEGELRQANDYLFNKIVDRMHLEHKNHKMVLDKPNGVIQLIEFYTKAHA